MFRPSEHLFQTAYSAKTHEIPNACTLHQQPVFKHNGCNIAQTGNCLSRTEYIRFPTLLPRQTARTQARQTHTRSKIAPAQSAWRLAGRLLRQPRIQAQNQQTRIYPYLPTDRRNQYCRHPPSTGRHPQTFKPIRNYHVFRILLPRTRLTKPRHDERLCRASHR